MKDTTKRGILYVASVAAAALLVLLYVGILPGGIVISEREVHPSEYVEGRILAIEDEKRDGANVRYAKVKLSNGDEVRASIGGCLVFPGQIARLAKYGIGREGFYVVTENGRNDS
jgi:hypothetical protein